MKQFDVFEFYQYMEKHHVIISFKGEISQKLLISIGDLLKDKLSQKETSQQVVKKVFFIFIELGQNIYRYSSERDIVRQRQIGMGVLFIREFETHFTVFTGNIVTPEEAEGITELCESINRLEPDELRQRYKDQMKQPREDGQIGAGLGLISIVRKTGNPIEVNTTVMDETQTFLALSVRVNKE
jgi:hypothetical protein